MTGGLPDKVDAVFLMDGSGSIDAADEFYKAKHLVSQVLMKMNIGEDKVGNEKSDGNSFVSA